MKSQKRIKSVVSEKGVSRSQLIRDFVASNPGLSVAAIAEQLAAAGTPVSAGLIYQVLRNDTKKKAVTRKAKPVSIKAKPVTHRAKPVTIKAAKPANAAGNGAVFQSPEVFTKMFDFVESAGGLKQAAAILHKLQS